MNLFFRVMFSSHPLVFSPVFHLQLAPVSLPVPRAFASGTSLGVTAGMTVWTWVMRKAAVSLNKKIWLESLAPFQRRWNLNFSEFVTTHRIFNRNNNKRNCNLRHTAQSYNGVFSPTQVCILCIWADYFPVKDAFSFKIISISFQYKTFKCNFSNSVDLRILK